MCTCTVQYALWILDHNPESSEYYMYRVVRRSQRNVSFGSCSALEASSTEQTFPVAATSSVIKFCRSFFCFSKFSKSPLTELRKRFLRLRLRLRFWEIASLSDSVPESAEIVLWSSAFKIWAGRSKDIIEPWNDKKYICFLKVKVNMYVYENLLTDRPSTNVHGFSDQFKTRNIYVCKYERMPYDIVLQQMFLQYWTKKWTT